MIEVFLALLVLVEFCRFAVEATMARLQFRVMQDSKEQTELLRQHANRQAFALAEQTKKEMSN